MIGLGIKLHAEQEMRRDQHGLQTKADAGDEVVSLPVGQLDQLEHAIDFGRRRRPAKRA